MRAETFFANPIRIAITETCIHFIVTFWAVAVLTGCNNDDAVSPSRGESVTGTYLEPMPNGADGFFVLDEECGHTDDPLYMNRFISTMFRDAAIIDNILYLVDGSFLWAVDMSIAVRPERVSLTRLPGTPVALAVQDSHTLYAASGEEGLVRIDVNAPNAPIVTAALALEGPALDVTVEQNLIFAVAGTGGLSVAVDDPEGQTARVLAHLPLPGFANGVDVQDGVAAVASCGLLTLVNVSIPTLPSPMGHFTIETGHAKDVLIYEGHAFVSAGEALFAFDIRDSQLVRYKGYYADPEADGFYVNGAQAWGNTLFIAAGDESVRSISISDICSQQGEDVPTWNDQNEEPPAVDGPYEFREVVVNEGFTEVRIVYGDPINLLRSDESLYVLGNFRWAGERLVRSFQIQADGSIVLSGQFAQPTEAQFIAADDTRTVRYFRNNTLEITFAENAQGIPAYTDTMTLTETPVRVFFSDDATFVLTDARNLFVHRVGVGISQTSLLSNVNDFSLGTDGTVYVADPVANRISLQHPGEAPQTLLSDSNQFFGSSRLHGTDTYLYAYVPFTGMLLQVPLTGYGTAAQLDIGLCENYDIDDYYNTANESEARMTHDDNYLYVLCPKDERDGAVVFQIAVSDFRMVASIPLSQGMYRDLLWVNNDLFVLRTDNRNYTFTIVRVDALKNRSETTLTGYAVSMTTSGGRILVGDNDLGIRYFDIPLQGAVFEVAPKSAVEKEVSL